MTEDTTYDLEADPLTTKNLAIEKINESFVECLNNLGYNGKQFRADTSRNFPSNKKVTVERTQEHQDELATVKILEKVS